MRDTLFASQLPSTLARMESLEPRQLLSAALGTAVSPTLANPGSSHLILPATVSTPSLVGLFSGTATSSKDGKVSGITIQITGQSRRNVLYGTLVVRQHGGGYKYFSLSGQITGRTFTLNFTGTNGSGTLAGTASADGKTLSGTYAVAGSKGDHGTFTVKR